jgi:hypothetical protein
MAIAGGIWEWIVIVAPFLTLGDQARKSWLAKSFENVSDITVACGFVISVAEYFYAFQTNAAAFKWSKTWNLVFSSIIFSLWLRYKLYPLARSKLDKIFNI